VREQYLATCSKELEIFLREKSSKKLKEIANCAEQYISAHKSSKGVFPNRGIRDDKRDDRHYDKRGHHRDQRDSSRPVVSSDGIRRCWICNSTKHVSKDCDERNGSKLTTKRTMAMRADNSCNEEDSDRNQDED
jgi:hypothetical protein